MSLRLGPVWHEPERTGLGRCSFGGLNQTWSRYRTRETGVVFAGTDVALGDRSESGKAH